MKPTLEEVKEHFRDAKKIKSLAGVELQKTDKIYFDDDNDCWMDADYWDGVVWSKDQGYAKIIEYKEFQLPKNYCIKVTDKNYKVLDEYFKRPYSFENKYAISVINGKFNSYISYKQKLKSYEWFSHGILPEITFEQFKKYVLKQ